MGWNSWNHFAEHIDDKTVRETADALVSTGLRDAGYIYLNIDDTWQGQRDANGIIHPNEKFPEMKALGMGYRVAYFHVYTLARPASDLAPYIENYWFVFTPPDECCQPQCSSSSDELAEAGTVDLATLSLVPPFHVEGP